MDIDWRRSTRCMGGTECVEVAAAAGKVAVRDSKDPGGPRLDLEPGLFTALIKGIKAL